MNAWSRKGTCQSGNAYFACCTLRRMMQGIGNPSPPWERGEHSDRVMAAAVAVLIHPDQTARTLLRRLARGRAAMGWRRDARRAAAHHAAQAAAAGAEVASHVAFRSPKWQLTFFHAVEGGRTPGSSRPGRWPALPQRRNRLSLMPWRRRRCPRRRRPRTGSSAATGCCRGRTFTRRPWAPRAACRRRPRAGSCPEGPPGHGLVRSLNSLNAERYEEQHNTATGSIRATARQQQSKKHEEHACTIHQARSASDQPAREEARRRAPCAAQ